MEGGPAGGVYGRVSVCVFLSEDVSLFVRLYCTQGRSHTDALQSLSLWGTVQWGDSFMKGWWARKEWGGSAVGARGPCRAGQPAPLGRRSESPSGAVVSWLALWPKSATRVPDAELKPPATRSGAARWPGVRAGGRSRGGARAAHSAPGFCELRPRESRADLPDARASSNPSFLCVCAWRRNY